MIITKGHTFGIPIRPKYMRLKKWDKYLKDNDLVITAEKINNIIDNMEYKGKEGL